MWLPKDERKLLAGYYNLIGKIQESRGYSVHELGKLLRWWPDLPNILGYGQPAPAKDLKKQDLSDDFGKLGEQVSDAVNRMYRVEGSNTRLVSRGLIELEKHQHENVVFISLTVDGYDLGRRYAHWWDRSGLRFQEYKNHWIWIILSFLGGVLGALLVNMLQGLIRGS